MTEKKTKNKTAAPKSLNERLLAVQVALKASKSQYNSFGKYHYRNCEDILEAVKPLLADAGLTLVIRDAIEVIGERYYVRAIATLTDGTDCLAATAYARESDDKKGMDAAQLTGATSSYARKYALSGLFLIDDTKDADTTNQGQEQAAKAPAPKPVASKTVTQNQLAALHALAVQKGMSHADIKKSAQGRGFEGSTKDMPVAVFNLLLKGLEKLPDAATKEPEAEVMPQPKSSEEAKADEEMNARFAEEMATEAEAENGKS